MVTRQQVTDFIANALGLIIPGDTYNSDLARKRFAQMDDEEFDVYIRSLAKPQTVEQQATQEIIPFYSPSMGETRIVMDDLMALADTLELKLFERLWITDPQTGRVYLTPNEYAVFDMLVRRQAQMLNKKSSIPEDIRHVDEMSGQVTGKSKGSKISFPEVQAQLAQNLTNTLIEEIKLRGGDQAAQVEFERQLIDFGEANIDDVTQDGVVTKSTSTVSTLFRGMMIENDIDEV